VADTFNALMKSITAKLKANTSVIGYVGQRIYSNVPQNTTFPYLRVSIDSAPYDSKDTTGMEHTITIACYSREPSPGEAGAIRGAVYNLLHRNESAFTLDSGSLVTLQYDGVGFVEQEPDGKTWQGLAQFRAVITD
jgi:hypothetical protein